MTTPIRIAVHNDCRGWCGYVRVAGQLRHLTTYQRTRELARAAAKQWASTCGPLLAGQGRPKGGDHA